MEQILKDQVVFVTGAGRGWGQSICLMFARHGARVIASARTWTELENTANLIRPEGGNVELLQLDAARDDELQKAANTILGKYGRLDVLVNNAAQLPLIHFEEMTQAAIDQVLWVNLRAPMALCRLFIEPMIKQGGGSMINVSSNAGVRPTEYEVAYCTSKFGLEGFSRTLAIELKSHNIAVNTITPGGGSAGVRMKPTSMTQAEFDRLRPEEKARYTDSIKYCDAFIYLALQRGSGVTGQRLHAYEMSEKVRREGWNTAYEKFPEPL